MDVLTVSEMIAKEEAAFTTGITAEALMDAAGVAMAVKIIRIYPHAQEFAVLVGKGNNGGDGLVVAAHLRAATGKRVNVALAAPEEELGDLPLKELERLRLGGPGVKITPWAGDFPFPAADGVLVDALLGVQAKGPLRDPLAGIVARVNAARSERYFRTVALDLPSGLGAYKETTVPPERDAAIVADVTLAVGYAKHVLVREALSAWVGRIEVIPWSNDVRATTAQQALVPHELARLLPRRSAQSFKGDFGKLAIVAGSVGFTGAPILCVQAAQAMGAGLLSVVTREDSAAIVAATAPREAMVSGWPAGGKVPKVVEEASAIAIGPGLGADEETSAMLRAVLAVGCPVLVDADGLNALAKDLTLLKNAQGPVQLTPHIGEMHRLIGRKFAPDERENVARDFVEKHNVTLVLKGTRTLVTAPGFAFFINTSGNPGLSTGGSGDTLSGIIAALLAQKLSPIDASRLGVWLHGHAADLVLQERGCEEGLTPTRLSAKLGAALVSLRQQAAAGPGLLETAQAEAKAKAKKK